MKPGPLLASLCTLVLAAAAATLVQTGAAGAATTSATCSGGTTGSPGYAYAGHQSSVTAHGVRGAITATRAPAIADGQVAGWIGVGGPGQGANGQTMWVQAGIAGIDGMGLVAYAEITRPGADPRFVALRDHVAVGERLAFAVLETGSAANRWRVWLDGRPVTAPIALPGSSARWKPIATAESFSAARLCNGLGFRFEQLQVAAARGGGWRTFTPGYQFLDRGLALRQLRPTSGSARVLARDDVQPFAFEATSTT